MAIHVGQITGNITINIDTSNIALNMNKHDTCKIYKHNDTKLGICIVWVENHQNRSKPLKKVKE